MIPKLLPLLLFYTCIAMGKNPNDNSPPWESHDLTDDLRTRAGGSFIRLSEGVTHYELAGPDTGEPVILVHGSMLPLWTWDRQTAVLAKAGYRVLRYDHYGRGYSDRPAVDYSIGLYIQQLHELADSLRIRKPFTLVGISFGCIILAVYAAEYPSDVNRMVFDAPPVDPLNCPGKVIAKSGLGALLISRQLEKQVGGGIRQTLKERGMPDNYADLFIEQATIRGYRRSLISFFRTIAVLDFRPQYRRTGQKIRDIMLVWGDHDKTVRKAQVKAFLKEIPHAKYHVIKGAGHLVPFEATEEFNALLLKFLRP